MSLVDWLDERVNSRCEFLSEGDDEQRQRSRAKVTADGLRDFAPCLVSVETERKQRLVRHAKFGIGEIIRETGDGAQLKYEIRFPDLGTEVLLATSVEAL